MQAAGNAVAAIFGVVLIALTLSDVFQSVIVPRAVGRRFRPSGYQWRGMWKLWPALAWRLHPKDEARRENILATFAPLALVVMLSLWVVLLVLGYGCIFWVLREQLAPVPRTFWEAAYFAGSSFFTIGFGDYTGKSGLTRLISLMAGASGLGVVSVTTAYLFALFGAFQVRQAFVVTLGARAGAPSSGVGLLAISKYAAIEADLDAVMRDGQAWTASVMESHLAYPTLAYFRSSHDYESWVGTLGTLLDAAVLILTTIEGGTGQAQIMYNIGRHATHDLAKTFRPATQADTAGITREEFAIACDQLRRAGYALRDENEAWEKFSALRAAYASELASLARFFSIPATPWMS